MATEFEEGVLTGLLIGEGHFGGDGRQPQVTLRMHERHEALFRWLERTYPGGRLYGPYEHGGRRYYQWMARGAYLRDELLPMLGRRISPVLDRYAFARFTGMCERYGRQLGAPPEPPLTASDQKRPTSEPNEPGRDETREGARRTDGADAAPGARAAHIFASLRDAGSERVRGT
jgi:hypothetical protein